MTMTNATRNIPRTANMQTQLATRNTNSQQKKERWGEGGDLGSRKEKDFLVEYAPMGEERKPASNFC